MILNFEILSFYCLIYLFNIYVRWITNHYVKTEVRPNIILDQTN